MVGSSRGCCDYIFSFHLAADGQLTMLGIGRHSLWNMCRQWKTTTLKGFAASARGRTEEELSATGRPGKA